MTIPESIVRSMMSNDQFSQWLGIEILHVKEGYSKTGLRIRPDMVNGFGIAHGGITFSLADSALAFASNSLGRHAVSTSTSIHHLSPVRVGDYLIAETQCKSTGHKLSLYSIDIYDQNDNKVAYFIGNVYRKHEEWKVE